MWNIKLSSPNIPRTVSYLTALIFVGAVERSPNQNLELGHNFGSHASLSALRVEPSLINEYSDLYITDLVRSQADDTRHQVLYPGEMFVIHFNEINVDAPEFASWVPVPNEIDACEFEEGAITCARVSDYAISLTIGDYVSEIHGHVGKIKNIPTTEIEGAEAMTINRIDFYTIFGNDLTGNFIDTIVPTDTTPYDTTFAVDVSQGVITDGAVSSTGQTVGQTGEDVVFTASFTPITILGDGGWIQIDIPLLYSIYDMELKE